MVDYEELIEAAIEKMVGMVNEEVALRQVRSVPDLSIADEGTVEELRAPGKEVLREVVEAYSNIMGGVAESLIAYKIRDTFEIKEVDLPDNLSKHL